MTGPFARRPFARLLRARAPAAAPSLSRRNFLKAAAAGLSALWIPDALSSIDGLVPGASPPGLPGMPARLPEFPSGERLGRVLSGKVEAKARPDEDSPTVKELFEDSVVVWLREVVGRRPLWITQRFIETSEGFIYAPNLQPVLNRPNQSLAALPSPEGMWVEVSVPYVDIVLANPPARSPWLGYTTTPRLYYSQVMWVDQIQTGDTGQVLYRLSDRYGGFGDFFWAPAEAFRPIQPEEYAPINPEVEDKLVQVNLSDQTLSCIENGKEIYFCRVSTGPKVGGKTWATPLGKHTIWRKLVSVHMTGGTTGGGYDLAGIGWTTLFSSKGMAIHSTFWHNNYGIPQSHGCVNANPDDALWIFRWTHPGVPNDTGDITVAGAGSTKVLVYEA